MNVKTKTVPTLAFWCSQNKARILPGMKEGQLVQMLDRQRVQQAAADEAKKLVDAAGLAAERLVRKQRHRLWMQRRQLHFFTHSDPHVASPSHGRFLTGMSDDDLLQRQCDGRFNRTPNPV
jgi:hypothetical protein